MRIAGLVGVALLLVTLCAAGQAPAVAVARTTGARGVERPLPDVQTLLRSVIDNQKNVEQVVRNYIFSRDEQQDELDDDGKVKKTTMAQYETFFVGNRTVSRLMSRNGKPLDAGEQKKEEERVQKEIRKAQERQAKEEANQEKKATVTIATFLRACRMMNPRRERFRGREVIAVDFEPNPEFKASSKGEELAQKLGGTFWVDEDALQVVRLEARLLSDVKFGGFLASVHKGAGMVFEQERVNEEVWLPSYMDANLSFRVIFKGKREHVTQRYSNFRKFRVDTAIRPAE